MFGTWGSAENGRFPYITPLLGPSDLASGTESDLPESYGADVSGSARIAVIKLGDELKGLYIVSISPRIFFVPVTLPRDQELQFSSKHATVEDFFDFVVFFAIDDVGWRNVGTL